MVPLLICLAYNIKLLEFKTSSKKFNNNAKSLLLVTIIYICEKTQRKGSFVGDPKIIVIYMSLYSRHFAHLYPELWII